MGIGVGTSKKNGICPGLEPRWVDLLDCVAGICRAHLAVAALAAGETHCAILE